MFDWLLRYVLLRGLPSETIEACIAHPEIRSLLQFRFAYLFAFYGPVLVPLLELLSGQHNPALGIFALGLSSFTMVLADVPTGLFADRYGAKAALRLGLRLTCGVLLCFFLLGVFRAWTLARGGPPGAWLPGIIGLLVLETAIGVSLALLSGADTVLFLAVARRSGIAGLHHRGFEGIGSSIRYFGTMVAVVVGAILYDGMTALVKNTSLRIGLQSGLFLLTLLAMGIALRALARLPDLREGQATGHSLRRPGFYAVAGALREVIRWPVFFSQMWLLCLTSSASLFAVYVMQSPLSRLTTALAKQSPRWWPLYTCIAAIGYWASSSGSLAFRRHHQRDPEADANPTRLGRAPLWFAFGSLMLLGLYPMAHFGHRLFPDARWPLLLAAALVCFFFNYLRGFVEPYSATAIIAFTQEKGLSVPVSLVSVFNSLKRSVHFVLSGLFFVSLQGTAKASQDLDAVLSKTLLWVCVAFAILVLPGLSRAALGRPLQRQGRGTSIPALKDETGR